MTLIALPRLGKQKTRELRRLCATYDKLSPETALCDSAFTAGVPSGGPKGRCVMDFVRYLRTAIEILRLQHKTVAIEFDVDPPYLSNVLSGEKPFPYRRIRMLSRDIQREMCIAWADDLGLVIGKRAAVLKLAEGVLEMARAEEQEAMRALQAADSAIERMSRERRPRAV